MCGESKGRECGAEDKFPQALTRPLSSLDPRGISTTTGSQTAQELLRVEMQEKQNKTQQQQQQLAKKVLLLRYLHYIWF